MKNFPRFHRNCGRQPKIFAKLRQKHVLPCITSQNLKKTEQKLTEIRSDLSLILASQDLPLKSFIRPILEKAIEKTKNSNVLAERSENALLNNGFIKSSSCSGSNTSAALNESHLKKYFGENYDSLTVTQKEKIALSLIDKYENIEEDRKDVKCEEVFAMPENDAKKLPVKEEPKVDETLELSFRDMSQAHQQQESNAMASLELSGIFSGEGAKCTGNEGVNPGIKCDLRISLTEDKRDHEIRQTASFLSPKVPPPQEPAVKFKRRVYHQISGKPTQKPPTEPNNNPSKAHSFQSSSKISNRESVKVQPIPAVRPIGIKLARKNVLFKKNQIEAQSTKHSARPLDISNNVLPANSFILDSSGINKSLSEFTLSSAKVIPEIFSAKAAVSRKNDSFTSCLPGERKYPSPKIAGKNRGIFALESRRGASAEGRCRRKQLLQTPQFSSKAVRAKELEASPGLNQLKDINAAIARVIEGQYVAKAKPMSAAASVRRVHYFTNEGKAVENPSGNSSFTHGTVVNINIGKQTNYGNFIASREELNSKGFPKKCKGGIRVRPEVKKTGDFGQGFKRPKFRNKLQYYLILHSIIMHFTNNLILVMQQTLLRRIMLVDLILRLLYAFVVIRQIVYVSQQRQN
eukprot:TRINITY_DN599_c1_g1_i1.p1 TRINITY_DN599_c1_g1~~TRINITY_DN599_c1_g1_i1.p1  ORF type:complete len:633 (-),score=41.24 TRINITY_DN599_c1_g1_i1:4137-6035(-)